MEPNVTIIILNWNGWKDTIECLESVYQINYSNYNVIVVDNNSEDNSVENIKDYCKGKLKIESSFFEYDPENKPIKVFEYNKKGSKIIKVENTENESFILNKNLVIIKNDQNAGFADGNNVGIRYAIKILKSDYVLLLNNDTIVEKNFLNELIKENKKDINSGIVGSKIYFYNNPNLIQTVGVRINWYLGEAAAIRHENKNIDLDAVTGCSMLIKKDVISKIGFLNTNYFLYYEDTDFCIRAKRSGFKITCAHSSKIWHKTSVSTAKTSGIREYYSARNLLFFMRKYAARRNFYCFLIYFFFIKIWFTLALIIFYHKELKAVVPFLKGSIKGLIRINQIELPDKILLPPES